MKNNVNVEGVYTHNMKEPFEYEGKVYDEIKFDFNKLTGEDYIAIEDEMASLNKILVIPEFSTSFLVRMAAKASGVATEVLNALPLNEFAKIRGAAKNFLSSME